MNTRGILVLLMGILTAAAAHGEIITFEGLEHGRIVDTQFQSSHGVTIGATNLGGGPDLAVSFDTTRTGTADPDLEGPPWSTGNLAPDTLLGNVLIVQENSYDANHDGIMDSPDDEGSRPAGIVRFEFDRPILSFGFDIIDVEGPEEFGDNSGYVAVFYIDDAEIGRVGFADLLDSQSPFYDPTIAFGDNSANRIGPITAAELNATAFDRVDVNLGGSGGIDNVKFVFVPEPITLASMAIGAAFVALRTRRRLRL